MKHYVFSSYTSSRMFIIMSIATFSKSILQYLKIIYLRVKMPADDRNAFFRSSSPTFFYSGCKKHSGSESEGCGQEAITEPLSESAL